MVTAEELNLTKAAEKLFIAQPPLEAKLSSLPLLV
jgi:DNA-binding transcriptional LysR family regulator